MLNVAVTVLVVVYGIWLRNVIAQQLKSKDAALDALKAALTSKDAEIARLKAEAAPSIVQEYSTVKQYAMEMTAEKQRTSEMLLKTQSRLDDTMARLSKSAKDAVAFPAKLKLNSCKTILQCVNTFQEQLGLWLGELPPSEVTHEALKRFQQAFHHEIEAVSIMANEAKTIIDMMD